MAAVTLEPAGGTPPASRRALGDTATLTAILRRPRTALGIQGAVIFAIPLLLGIVAPGALAPLGVLIQGYILGGLYGLLAVGLILVYRANRIISFAQASLGSVPAVAALTLLARRGVPYAAVVPIVLLGAAFLGAVVELVLRRLSGAPRLIFTVATIGVGLLLAFVELITPSIIGGVDTGGATFHTPFSDFAVQIGITRITGDYFVALVVIAVCVAGVGAFFRFTDIGLAARASAENAERAALVGIPVRRISLIVWILAAVLSGIAVFLRGPLVGLPTGGTAGPSVLIFGLAAAVIGKMEDGVRAFGAAMGIGMIVQVTQFRTGKSSIADGVLLIVILIALLSQRQSLSRGKDTGIASWQVARDQRGIPSELINVPEVRYARQGVWALIGIAVLAAPLVFPADAGRLAIVCCYAIAAVSLVILTGWAGQISLGQFGFAGVGGLVTAHLASNLGWDMWTVLVCAGLAGAFTAVLVGLPALRIQGLFLAVTTLAFAFTVQDIVLNKDYTGHFLIRDQLKGVERPALYGRVDLAPENRFYYLCLALLACALASASVLRRTRAGRVLLASRDNGKAAQAYGISIARTRLAAFALSGFFAAVAGSLMSFQLGNVNQGTFTPLVSISLLAAVVIGGTTSLSGAMLGTLWVFGIPLLLEKRIAGVGFLAGGVGLLLLLLVLPGGLAELVGRGRDKYLRWVANRRGIVVPSLVADVRTPDAVPPTPVEAAAAIQAGVDSDGDPGRDLEGIVLL